MYDELVKRLRNRRICIQQSGSLDDFPLLKEAADAIEWLTALSRRHEVELVELTGELASKPRWIPVTERLPENGKYLVAAHFLGMGNEPLLVSIADYAQSLESVDKYDFEGDNRPGWYCYDSEYGFYERKGIRFYMPLPEPPKEERA